MILILSIFLLPILLTYLLQRAQEALKPALPPGPPPLPLIGNLHQLAAATSSGDLHVYLWRLSKQLRSPIFHLKVGYSTPLIVISSAKLAKEVLKTQDLAFCSRPITLVQKKYSYNNKDIVFSPYNDYWREMRKFTTIHLFSSKKLQSLCPVREEEVACTVAKISSLAEAGRAVNLSEVIVAHGTNLICRAAFGRKYLEAGPEMTRFKRLLEEGQAMAMAFFVTDFFPALGWVDRLTGKMDALEEIFRKFDAFYQELIDDHVERGRGDGRTADDFLDTLLQFKEESQSSSLSLTWDNIKALLMNIFIAGSDTSSAAVLWTMTALIKNPNVMQKLQAQIRTIMGKKGKIDEDDLSKLPYIKAVVNESFRLYPPGPLIPRETMEKCFLDGYEIGPKTMLYVNAYAVGRDPEYWENPEEFMPERFLNGNIDVKGQDFGLIPFGSGRRICPGMPIGVANVELTVANLLYNFDWELPPGIRAKDVDTNPAPGLAVMKKNPLVLIAKKYCV